MNRYLWALSFLLLFLILWGLIQRVTPWDREMVLWVSTVRLLMLNRAVAWLTNLGSINILGPLAVIIAAGFLWRGRRLWALAFLGTLIWYPLLWPLRLAADRSVPESTLRAPTEGILYLAESRIERVPTAVPGERTTASPSWKESLLQSLKRSMGKSFPSSHAAVSAYFYGLWLLWAWLRRSIITAFLIAALIGLIGLSRLYMAVHYPTDIFAAWSLAAAALVLQSDLLSRERIESLVQHSRR